MCQHLRKSSEERSPRDLVDSLPFSVNFLVKKGTKIINLLVEYFKVGLHIFHLPYRKREGIV